MDVFLPLASEATIRGRESSLDERGSGGFRVVARLQPDQSIDQAAAALNAARPAIRDATLPVDEDADAPGQVSQRPSDSPCRHRRSTGPSRGCARVSSSRSRSS